MRNKIHVAFSHVKHAGGCNQSGQSMDDVRAAILQKYYTMFDIQEVVSLDKADDEEEDDNDDGGEGAKPHDDGGEPHDDDGEGAHPPLDAQ